MTKSIDISDDAAAEFDDVRKIIRAVNGGHPDNSDVIFILCNRFKENAGVK